MTPHTQSSPYDSFPFFFGTYSPKQKRTSPNQGRHKQETTHQARPTAIKQRENGEANGVKKLE